MSTRLLRHIARFVLPTLSLNPLAPLVLFVPFVPPSPLSPFDPEVLFGTFPLSPPLSLFDPEVLFDTFPLSRLVRFVGMAPSTLYPFVRGSQVTHLHLTSEGVVWRLLEGNSSLPCVCECSFRVGRRPGRVD
jgi:hypothetical protein